MDLLQDINEVASLSIKDERLKSKPKECTTGNLQCVYMVK